MVLNALPYKVKQPLKRQRRRVFAADIGWESY